MKNIIDLQPKKTFYWCTEPSLIFTNSFISTNLFYVNLTNTQFENVPIFHFRHTMNLANSENMMKVS